MYSEKNCIITINDENCIIEGRCLLSNKIIKVKAKTEDYEKWVKGEGKLDDLMPYLTASEKNFICHGVTDEGWEEVTNKDKEKKISIPKPQQ